jgi:sugar phosphate permease
VNSRRAWLVVSIGTFAYLIAVLQRTSLGVAGVQATERFDVQAAALSSLTVVQLLVYAALQIPVGVALDRLGPRFLISLGAALMMLGQITLALAPNIVIAVLGRVLVGAGDAMTFISVQRLLASWFGGKALPLLTQSMGTVGQAGQLLSALPLSFLLHSAGWETAFLVAGSASALALVLVLVLVANGPGVHVSVQSKGGMQQALHNLRESISRPGTQLGFWSHFVTQSSATMLSLLWGFPFLSVGLGYGPTAAAALITLFVISAAVTGPLLGILTARYPYRRSNVVLGIVIAMAIVWALVLLWPGQPPLWLVILLILVVAVGGPGSLIGFDFARTFNPARSLGSATGVVNTGGFFAAFVMMLLVGIALDVVDRARGGTGVPAELYSLDSFRIAFLVQYPVVGVGLAFLIYARRRTRRRLHEEEGIEVGPLWVSLVRSLRKRRDAAGQL